MSKHLSLIRDRGALYIWLFWNLVGAGEVNLQRQLGV